MVLKLTRWMSRALLSGMLLVGPVLVAQAETPVDPDTGLKVAPGWQLVRAHCSGCHSLKLVTGQRGSRARWLSTIRWMQQKQNLWPIPEDQESQILDYLAAEYAPGQWGRRPPLPASLLPTAPTPKR
ncbi:MAG: hypothetical protein AAF552_07835 [Pseudomonadota bacterium]